MRSKWRARHAAQHTKQRVSLRRRTTATLRNPGKELRCKESRLSACIPSAPGQLYGHHDAGIVGKIGSGHAAAMEVRDETDDVETESEMRLAVCAAAAADERLEQSIVEVWRKE